MTVRDNIYKNYQQGGEALMTLKWGLLREFIEFIEHTNFEKKSVLDIGCGTGSYLVYLKTFDFKVAGRDSSPTAVEMAKDAIGNERDIICTDMYATEIQPDSFDLIMSIRTIHHGGKDKVKKIIEKIYEALLPKGKIFITLPDYENRGNREEIGREVAPGTFVQDSGPEAGLPHSFFTPEEIKKLFSKFKSITYTLDDDKVQWAIAGEK